MSARRTVRYLGLVAVTLFVSACLYLLGNRATPSAVTKTLEKGYRSPSTVLPDYISPHGIPPCDADQDMVGRFAGTSSGEEDRIDTTKIEGYLAQHLKAKQGHFNPQADKEWLGIDLGPWDLASYRQELMDTYTRYLTNATKPSYMHLVESRLSLRPRATYPASPRQILTTTKEMPLPTTFQRWRSLHRGWKLRIFDDDRMQQWIDGAFGGTRGKEVWDSLPRAVLKTDVFRFVSFPTIQRHRR